MFKCEHEGMTYTFYEGDQQFSEVDGVQFSARKLASMTDHPARIKHEGRVLWCGQIYFAELVNKLNPQLNTRQTKPGIKRPKTSGNQRLSVEKLRIVGGQG